MHQVVGLFESRGAAESTIHRLKETGIGLDLVSIALKDEQDARELAESTGAEDLSGEGATAGAISGAAVGTLVGLALLGSTIVLPGVGTFLVGGPLAAALTGAGIGAASGGLIGALIGSGIPELEAEHYSKGIESGGILVSSRVPDDLGPTVEHIYQEEGATRTTLTPLADD